MAKSKKRKGEAEQPDPFLTFGIRVVEYTREHIWSLIAGAVVVLVLLSLAIYWPYLKRERELTAAQAARPADELLETPGGMGGMAGLMMGGNSGPSKADLEKAVEKYLDVAEEYPHTGVGRRSLLHAGDAALKLVDKAEDSETQQKWARSARDAFQRASGKGARLERFSALSGLGAAHESLGDPEAAAEAYRKIVTDGRMPFRDTATLDLARALASAGKVAEARELLEGFEDEFPSSSLKDAASNRLAVLGDAPETDAEGEGEGEGAAGAPGGDERAQQTGSASSAERAAAASAEEAP